MRVLALVLVGALVCTALAQEDAPRGRVRTRLISRQRLADVIDGAVAVEESGQNGRKRVLVRRPGSARRRVKVIRRPRPGSTTAAPSTAGPTTAAPAPTTFAPAPEPVFSSPAPTFNTVPVFRPQPTAAPEPQQFAQQQLLQEPEPAPRQRGRRPAIPARAAPTSAPRRQQPAEPIGAAARKLNRKEEVVGTITNYSYYNEDGSFTFGYEAEDGSFKEETRGTDCVVRGKYGYIDPDGVKREFTYESGNPCDGEEEAIASAQFDEQGFPILDEGGRLEGGVDPLDDQPIRRPNTQFISQTKEEPLAGEELERFRSNNNRRRRPQGNRRQPTAAPEPTQPATEPAPVTFRPATFRPRPVTTFVSEPETRPTPTFRPRDPEPTFTSPEPRPQPQPTFRPQPQPTFRPQPQPTFRPQPPRTLPPQPRPQSTFRPKPVVTVVRQPQGAFNFDEELRGLQQKPTQTPAKRPSLDANDPDLSLSRPSGPVAGAFDHQLVFDPTTGKHRTDLVQRLPEGTEIRIGENLNSFSSGPRTTTEKPKPASAFSNNLFQSIGPQPPTRPQTRPPPPPPPTTRPTLPPPPSPTTRRPAPQNFNTFRQPAAQPPPQQFRPQPFTVFNTQPRPQGLPPRPQGLPQRPQGPPPQQRPVFSVFNQPRPPPPQSQPQPQQSTSASRLPFSSTSAGSRPVQQVSFGTQVTNPVFARFGVPQPFRPFVAQPQSAQQGQFRPPQPINFFGSGQN